MSRIRNYLYGLPLLASLLMPMASVEASNPFVIDGQSWRSGVVEGFDTSVGLIVIDGRRYRLAPELVPRATDMGSSDRFRINQEVLFIADPVLSHGSVGLIRQIRGMEH